MMSARAAGTPTQNRPPHRTALWAYALWPLGLCFHGAARMRAFLYGRVLRPVRLGRPTVSVGNLTFGGTGKTPVAIFLAERLRAMGAEPAVMLRGYGRETRGPLKVSPGHSAGEVGEEALLIARSLPGLTVVVAERREEGEALLGGEVDAIILDDAFQHLRVHRDLNLLLVDVSRPEDLRAPPVGRLRESLSAASRADLIVATRGDASDLPGRLRSASPGLPTVSARFMWSEAALSRSGEVPWQTLRSKPVVAFAAIGNPEAFFAQAEEMGLPIASRHGWPDHAEPTPERLNALRDDVRRTGAGSVLATMKDAVKWEAEWPLEAPLVYPGVRVQIEDPEGRLDALLGRLLESNP